MEEIIAKIVEDWFLSEPALFATYCTHTLEENTKMCVPMRCGKMRIEYNPILMQDWGKKSIEERLKFEVIRILLGHPYQRQPYKATKAALGMASDVTLSTLYRNPDSISIPEDLKYDKGLCFEEYYNIVKAYLNALAAQMVSSPYDIEGLVPDGGGGKSDDGQSNDVDINKNDEQSEHFAGSWSDKESYGSGQRTEEITDIEIPTSAGDKDEDNNSFDNGEESFPEPSDTDDELAPNQAESAELWEEDQLMQEAVKEVIERAKRTHQWGSLAGNLSDMIEASSMVRIDYRRVLSWFRATVLSSRRRLTRMLPSRRYGFQFMGSKRDFCTKLLVAIDVSGSVDDRQVSQALSIINRFFKYGIENIEVIQFDCGLVGEPISMKKAKKAMKIGGRGGTDFQSAIDFFSKGKYDGLIMITDGYAPAPTLPENTKGSILWLIYNENCFRKGDSQTLDEYSQWIATFPKSRYVILPPVV